MRLDLFLKTARLVKRRSLAKEMIEVGAVRLCGRIAKPSSEVKQGDVLEIAFPRRVIEVEVLADCDNKRIRGEDAISIMSDRRLSEGEKPW